MIIDSKRVDEEITKILKVFLDESTLLQPIGEEENLYHLGLNSTKVISLIVELEVCFNIFFEDNELLFENFCNVQKISTRVKRKLNDINNPEKSYTL